MFRILGLTLTMAVGAVVALARVVGAAFSQLASLGCKLSNK